MIRAKYYNYLIVLILIVITGCVGRTADWDPSGYTVRSGDTVYSIAWRYELDPADLARWNNLGSNDLIRPGQRLYTRPPPSMQTGTRTEPAQPAEATVRPESGPEPADTIVVRRGDTLYSLSRRHGLSVEQMAAANGLIKPYVIVPGQTLSVTAGAPVAPPTAAPEPVAADGRITWTWPAQGTLIGRFNQYKLDAKGIDIAGKEGDRVRAAAPGKVVYSGNGLINYGNLVIIKHNRAYLSAYAHNRKLLVREGQQVGAGETIAELGRTGTDKPRLHFEIRKNGKPVDPLRYLPGS